MQLLWFIPTHGDGRYLATATGGRAVSFPSLSQQSRYSVSVRAAGQEACKASCRGCSLSSRSLIPEWTTDSY
ncbi:hypothetical protein [Nostoc sp. NMS9]|nr:hypothetical protein [Nostoc sp. NMS9]